MQEYSSHELSKRKISDSLFSLLHKTDFHDISITDIVNDANVSRATFYRHFDSKEDVIHYYFDRLVRNFGISVLPNPKTMNDCRASVIKVLSVVKRNRGAIRLIAKADNGAMLLSYIDEQYAGPYNNSSTAGEMGLTPYIYSGAVHNLIMKWIAEDCATPEETLADVFTQIMPEMVYKRDLCDNENKGLQK